MARAILHMKSRKSIPIIHPWTAQEWTEWVATDRYASYADKSAVILVCDEKGNQFVVCAYEVEFVMIPLEEENDGK